MFPNVASQMRTASSSMVANTGWRSPGGATDDLKNFRRGSLLLQRFREVGCALGEVGSALAEL
jgi:hypothetical protein